MATDPIETNVEPNETNEANETNERQVEPPIKTRPSRSGLLFAVGMILALVVLVVLNME
jgi:hypothetical protein